MIGFDEEVYLVIQPYDEFYDYTGTQVKGGAHPVTKLIQMKIGRKFFIPAEYDMVVYFRPTGNSNESPFRFK